MKQFLLITLIGMGFTIGLAAKTEHRNNEIQVMSDQQIERMDRKHNNNKAKRRNFNTQKEYQHKTQRKHAKHLNKYDNGHKYDKSVHRTNNRIIRQQGYRYGKKGWTLAYRYDRASFYDNQGFYYGYFNRHGYYFDDVFYRYDRYYTYNDRVKGRGLFDHRYYMPANYRYYGFDRTPYNH